ncbi:MAG: hypothetical protein JSR86_05125 [Proteobacteria bacterium]|nr:hypothetical protein [Pseudomonadota bacterium]
MIRSALALAAGALLVLAAGGADAACSKPAIATAAAQARSAREALLSQPIGDGMVTDVAPPTRLAIAAMKQRLAALTDAYEACAAGDQAPAEAEAALAGLLGAPAEDSSGRYGGAVTFHAHRWPGGLMGVVADLQIECGSDSSLMLYRRDPDAWRPVLRWQAPPYAKVSGAFGAFDYEVSGPDAGGRWFVAAKSVMPWCSSTWSQIRYAIVRPGPTATSPRVLLSRADPIWWGGDDEGTLAVTPMTVDLRFHAESIDSDVHNRLWIRRFAVEGDAVRRVPPLAATPRDFADEWIVSPWLEASQWTAPAARARLAATHRALRKIHFLTFDAVRRCGTTNRYQVRLLNADTPYVLTIAAGETLRLLDVTGRPDPACGGPNLLDEMATR